MTSRVACGEGDKTVVLASTKWKVEQAFECPVDRIINYLSGLVL